MNFDHDLPGRTPADSEQRESHPSFQTIIGTDTSRTKKKGCYQDTEKTARSAHFRQKDHQQDQTIETEITIRLLILNVEF